MTAKKMTRQGKIKEQRRQAAKTAWLLAIIAALIFIAFFLSGVLRS